MLSNLDNNPIHPQELLEGFALNALEPDEEQSVAAHLDGCAQCAAVVEEGWQAAAALAQTVVPLAPRPELRLQLLNALEALPAAAPAESAAAPAIPIPAPQPEASRGFWRVLDALFAARWMRVLMPAATATAVALVVVAVILNAGMSREITELRAQMDSSNATLSAQMADDMGQAMAADLSLQQIIQQVQEASLALARPGSRTALLSAPGRNSGSEGVLVLGEDDAATIIASGLAPTASGQTYQIWLMGPWENRMIGTLAVNADGWGAVSLNPQEPVSQYERVGLMLGAAGEPASAPPDMEEENLVLAGEIRALRPPDRMVQMPWPQPRLR